METKLLEALDAGRCILGAEHVHVDGPTCKARSGATFAGAFSVPLAIIEPPDRAAVEACLEIARHHHIAVYPISKGRNWGYGGALPYRSDCVVFSLERLDAIRDFDEHLGSVTVEPGASFGDLARLLRNECSCWTLNCPGSGPEASVVGLHLEKGLVPGPDPMRSAAILGLEVLLADGTLAILGEQGGPSTPGMTVGPDLIGLFLQSGHGIVLSMRIALSNRPAYYQYASFSVADHAFETCLTQLHVLRKTGTLGNSIALQNSYHVLASGLQYPWEATGGVTPLPHAFLAAFEGQHHNAHWFGEFAIEAADDAEGLAKRARVAGLLAAFELDTLTLTFGDRDADHSFINREQQSSLRTMYWRKRAPGIKENGALVTPALNPSHDDCGILWVTAVVPFQGHELRAATHLLEHELLAQGFEPLISVRPVCARRVIVLAGIVYDRLVSGEDAHAKRVYDHTANLLVRRGFPPHRLGIQAIGLHLPIDGGHQALLRRIKSALDPEHLIAPGRYVF